mmetsp:Transcript_9309/g.23742  ORF Transcript_9309/g.23742 Transcript_9309/m.23742 type:complete len:382 (+) Transcript_9309:560-1705(+)
MIWRYMKTRSAESCRSALRGTSGGSAPRPISHDIGAPSSSRPSSSSSPPPSPCASAAASLRVALSSRERCCRERSDTSQALLLPLSCALRAAGPAVSTVTSALRCCRSGQPPPARLPACSVSWIPKSSARRHTRRRYGTAQSRASSATPANAPAVARITSQNGQLLVADDLRSSSAAIIATVPAPRKGVAASVASVGSAAPSSLRRTKSSTAALSAPAHTGESTHDAAMAARPGQPQSTHLALVPTSVMPMTAPTMACVVDTGMPAHVAARRNSAPAASAQAIPSMKSVMRPLGPPQSQHCALSRSLMPLTIVSLTPLPNVTAPSISATPATRMAVRMETAPLPTEVPKLLATSLAPMVNASRKAVTVENQKTPLSSVGSW